MGTEKMIKKSVWQLSIILMCMFAISDTAMAANVSLIPQVYARDEHHSYTSRITAVVRKKAVRAHKAIRNGKKKQYWLYARTTNEIRAVLAYMSAVYLPYQTEDEWPDCDNVFRSKGSGYELNLHPARYKKLRQRDRYVRDIVKKAIRQMRITTFTPEADAVTLVNDWICKHVDYDWRVNDPKALVFYWTAYDGLRHSICVCEGYADIFQIFMNELGIRGYRLGSNKLNHIWNVVVLDGVPTHVDVCWNDTGNAYNWLMKQFTDHGNPRTFNDIRDTRNVVVNAKRVFYSKKKGF